MSGIVVDTDNIQQTLFVDDPYVPLDMVRDRFNDTIAKADEVYTMLIGAGGDSGLLGEITSAIMAAPAVNIDAGTVSTSLALQSSGQVLPIFDAGALHTFPTASYTEPTMGTLPSIDTDFSAIAEPGEVPVVLTWSEAALPNTLYNAALTRMLADLQAGATGLDPIVEQAMYDRARLRQQAKQLEEWNRLNDTLVELQHMLPSGVLVASLADYTIGATMADTEIENTILVTQGELTQKNSQFIIQQVVALEQLIRQTRDSESNRAFETAKAKATLLLQDYSARVQAYIAIWEGRKTKVMAQTEALRGAIESNKGLLDIFKTQWDSYKTQVEAVTSYNKGLTDVYTGRVQGYGEAERAVAAINESSINLIAEKIKEADRVMRGQIAEAEQTIAGYSAEQGVREKIASDVANIAAQVVASMLSAVHAGASIGYTGSESQSKSYQLSESVSESHGYEHDPEA